GNMSYLRLPDHLGKPERTDVPMVATGKRPRAIDVHVRGGSPVLQHRAANSHLRRLWYLNWANRDKLINYYFVVKGSKVTIASTVCSATSQKLNRIENAISPRR